MSIKKKFFPVFLLVLCSVFVFPACTPNIGDSTVLSGYNSMFGVNGGRRDSAHVGVDFGAPRGTPILAAADGNIVRKLSSYGNITFGCGNGVVIDHEHTKFFTVYCHMDEVFIESGHVKRGQVIGTVGISGRAMNVPHLHFVVTTSRVKYDNLEITRNPLTYIVGCYDSNKVYPEEKGKLVLTVPVECQNRM